MKNLLRVVLVLALAAGLTACKKNVKDDANADLTAGNGTEMVLEETETVEEVPAQEVALGVVPMPAKLWKLTRKPSSLPVLSLLTK